jgi:hypothetical protein
LETGAAAMVILQLSVVVPEAVLVESTTLVVRVNAPPLVGDPVIAPEPAFRVKPLGSDPEMIENV